MTAHRSLCSTGWHSDCWPRGSACPQPNSRIFRSIRLSQTGALFHFHAISLLLCLALNCLSSSISAVQSVGGGPGLNWSALSSVRGFHKYKTCRSIEHKQRVTALNIVLKSLQKSPVEMNILLTRSMGRTIMVMSPWYSPLPFTRAWCVFEAYCAATVDAKFEIAMSQVDEKIFFWSISKGDAERSINFMLAN